MRWSLPIGTVRGISLRLHFTFFLFLGLMAWLGWDAGGWLGSILFLGVVLVMFGCILLHELGHAIAALYYGVRVPSITLLPIGGVASMGSIPENPWQEFVIAVAGPLVNVAIALLLALVTGWWPTWREVLFLENEPQGVVQLIELLNLRLVVFNLIPAFPMDGGRVLRALLASLLPYERATAIAAFLGRFIALFFILAGPMVSFILSLIGLFVFFGAGYENRWVRLRERLRGRDVGQVMHPVAAVLRPNDPLSSVLNLIHRVPQLDFPVLDNGRLVGLLPRAAWMDASELRYDDPPVHELMDTHFLTVRPQTEVVRLIHDRKLLGQSVFPVVEDGRMVGYVTRDDVETLLQQRAP